MSAKEKTALQKIAFRIHCILDYKVLTPVLLMCKRHYWKKNPNADLLVNIGGGLFINRCWKNMDYRSDAYPNLMEIIDYHVDLWSNDPFPLDDGSVTLFYQAHCFEHIPQECSEHIFSEMYRCLKPGGAVRVSLPDYDKSYRKCLEARGRGEDGAEEALIERFASILAGNVDRKEIRADFESMGKEEFADHYASRVPREEQRAEMANHINWFNYDKLDGLFRKAGFAEVRKATAYDSRFPQFHDKGKFLGIEKLTSLEFMLGFDKREDISVFAEAVKGQ